MLRPKALILMHNINVMHQDRNVSESILSLCMDMEKTKDNDKSQIDLTDICNHPTLELTKSGRKPRVTFCIKPKDKKEVLKWIKN